MDKKNQFSFLDYHLINIHFDFNQEFENDKTEQNGIEINPKFDINYRKDEKHIFVNLNIELKNPKAPFTFDIGIVGIFEFGFDTSSENMESVVNINCAAILFPFLRETIADITRRAGFLPLILPPVNFVNLYKHSMQQEKEV